MYGTRAAAKQSELAEILKTLLLAGKPWICAKSATLLHPYLGCCSWYVQLFHTVVIVPLSYMSCIRYVNKALNIIIYLLYLLKWITTLITWASDVFHRLIYEWHTCSSVCGLTHVTRYRIESSSTISRFELDTFRRWEVDEKLKFEFSFVRSIMRARAYVSLIVHDHVNSLSDQVLWWWLLVRI